MDPAFCPIVSTGAFVRSSPKSVRALLIHPGVMSLERATESAFVAGRTSALKKRFQSILYLRRESWPVVERVQPWVAAVSAATAGAVAFSLQLLLGRSRLSAGQQLGSGLLLLVLIAALAYGTKERLQLASQRWLARRMGHFYAHQATRFFAADGTQVVTARESFDNELSTATEPDSLVTSSTVKLRFVHRGRIRSTSRSDGQLRLIFRYDLSPLFPRLHDPVKTVGVVDREARRVHFVDAPRGYKLSLHATLRCDEVERTTTGSLILDKFGLHRFEAGRA